MDDKQLRQRFWQNLNQCGFFDGQQTAIVAVSTGVDSMVLLSLLLTLQGQHLPKLIVAHVNHELRPQSVAEEQFIQEFCRQHGLELAIHHWPADRHPNTGIEAAARKERYVFFAALMKKYSAKFVLTAHHENDQVETTMMKLARGGQLSQMLGMRQERPFRNGLLLRPLLNISKEQLLDYARAKGIQWFDDETNNDLSIERNRFRHVIVPEMQRENNRFFDHVISYQQQLDQLIEFSVHYLDEIIDDLGDANGQLDVFRFLKLTSGTQTLVLKRWLEMHNVSQYSEGQVAETILALSNPNKPQMIVELNDNYQIVKRYNVFSLRQNKGLVSHSVVDEMELPFAHWVHQPNRHAFAVFQDEQDLPDNSDSTKLWLPETDFPLQVRRWHANDQIRLKNGHHQSVRRILINNKVANERRRTQLVVTTANEEVVWVVGQKFSWLDRPKNYLDSWKSIIFAIDKGENNG